MDAAERRDRIVEYLRIKPISHGQIYTFQIAIPESEVVELPFEKREQLKMSLTQQGTNIIPLIVRRTEAYSEEEEYEVVYGADWCLVAKELDIEKLWVWVFNMTDEQAAAAKQEMQQLLGYSKAIPVPVPVQPVADETQSSPTIVKQIDKIFKELATLNQKIEHLTTSLRKFEANQIGQIAIDKKLSQLVTESVKRVVEEIFRKEKKQPGQIITPPDTQSQKFDKMTLSQLKVIAQKLDIKGRSKMKKNELIIALKKAAT